VQLGVKSFGGGSNRQNKSALQSLEPSRRLSDFPGQSECELVCFICPPGDAPSSTLKSRSWRNWILLLLRGWAA